MMPRWFSPLFVVLLCCFTGQSQAQIVGGGGGGVGLVPSSCSGQVVTGLAANGAVQCATVSASVADNTMAKTGVDINTSHQVTATHLSAPLPVTQGGLGLASGTLGGLPYFSGTTSMASSALLSANDPVLGGGTTQPIHSGTRSGTTTTFGTVTGSLTQGRQVTFDSGGNLIVSGYTVGTPTQSGLSWNVTVGTCLGDGAGGKLTVNASNQIICAPDSGSGGSGSGVTSITATTPLTGGTITTTGTLGIQDAAADSATKGAATFTSEFRTVTSGVIGLNYAGMQVASGSQPGVLSAAGWTLFNNKQDTITWGAGLTASGTTAAVASTEAGFLTNGSGVDLVCGSGAFGKAQVMPSGDFQYCDGASPAVLHKGGLVQPGLTWAVTLSSCTSDSNSGKLTINGSNQIVCAPDVDTLPSNAAADGVTRGVVTFEPSEFVCAAGRCGLQATLANKILPNTTTATLKDTQLMLQNTTDTTKQARFDLAPLPTVTTAIYTLPPASDTLVGANATLTLASKTLASPIITGTPVGLTKTHVGLGNVDNTSNATERVTPATLQNKTLDSTNTVTLLNNRWILQDSTDPSKEAQWDLSANTTGIRRTYVLPNASDTLMCLTCPQTPVANKIISGLNNTITNVSLATGVTGQLPPANLAASGVVAGSYANASFTVNAAGQITSASSGASGIGGATARGLLYALTATTATSTSPLTDGQLVIGSTGNAPTTGTLSGTTNQIAVTLGPGSITLSLPTNPTLPGTTSGTFSGNLTGNVTGNVTGAVTGNASTATALAADPTACASNLFVTDIAAAGTLTCTQPSFANLSGAATSAQLPNPTSSLGGKVQAKDCTGIGHVLALNTDSTVTCSADAGAAGGLGDPGASGYVVRTSSGATVARTLTGTAGNLSITNGTGVSGNAVFDLIDTGVTAGSCTNCNLTYDAKGRITLAANGSGGGGGNITVTGTPSVGQAAEWVSGTSLQGVGVTGSGSYVKATSPTLVTPTLGAATVTTINKLAITPPTTSATLTIANGKIFQASNTLTLTGTDGSTIAVGGGGTVLYTTFTLNTTAPLTGGGDATTNRTLGCATCVTSASSLPLNQLVFGAGGQAVASGDLTGDVTTSGGKATTLATVNSTPGTFTNATVTVDGKGRITAAAGGSTAPITIVGTPSAGQVAEWTGTAALQGVSTTGTGSYVRASGPTIPNALLTTPTITVLDTVFTLQDDGDTTRRGLFQLSSVTPGTTRVLTWPDFSGTIATLAGVETYSNKTLANAQFTGAFTGPLLVGGTGTASALTLQSTAGVGATDSILFKTGNNGAITAALIDTTGNVGLGTAPSAKLHVLAPSAEVRTTGSATNQTIVHSFYDNNATLKGSIGYRGATGGGNNNMSLRSDAADQLELGTVNNAAVKVFANNQTRVTVDANGVIMGWTTATPQFQLDYSTASVATGLKLSGTAAGTAPILATLSTGTNEGLDINTKGTGSLYFHRVSTGDVLLGGQSPRVLGLDRHPTAATAGQSLTVRGGGAAPGGTNLAGGDLLLAPGQSTGTAIALTRHRCYVPATASGTGDTTAIDCVITGARKRISNNAAATILSVTVANNTSAAVEMAYSAVVRDAGNIQQVEGGRVICMLTNVGGTVSASSGCQKVGNAQKVSNDPSSTLTVTFDATNANPSLVTMTVASSLTPSTGFPLVSFPTITNLTEQAIAVQ